MKAARWLVLLLGTLVLAGCAPRSAPEGKGAGGDGSLNAERQYAIKGKVVEVDPGKPSVRLDHEEINGLMKGMEMEFAVEDRKMLEGLRPGDQVHGHLKVQGTRHVIVHLEKR